VSLDDRRAPAPTFFVPGRIEVLGKHTDYAGGRSLLVAVDRGFTVVVAPREDGVVRLTDSATRTTIDARAPEAPAWSVYPRTVVRRAATDFGVPLHGCDIAFASDLPPAAGLSSSTAFVTATFLALDAVSGLSHSDAGRRAIPDREALADYLAAVERGAAFPGLGEHTADGVGTRGGGEDHVAILCAVPDAVVRYAFEPTRREGVAPVPADHLFAVACSGVRAEKTGAARERYNRLSDLATDAARSWRQASGQAHRHLGAALAAAGPEAVMRGIRDAAGRSGAPAVVARAKHFIEECDLVDAAFHALTDGDLACLGEVAERSHALAQRLLGNQIPETDTLASIARDLGAAAASPFGAGFGGAVWALVQVDVADGFLECWRGRYLSRYAQRAGAASFFITRAAPPACGWGGGARPRFVSSP